MNSIITYLFFGIVWDVILSFISTITDGDNKLNNYERVISLVIWPVSLCIFIYHFVKTYFSNQN